VEVWMKEWLIVLNSTGTDGPVLSVLFNGGDTNIFERDGVYYLRSTAFDGLTDPREVYEKGLSLLPVVNGAAMLQIGHYSPVTPSAVASLDDGRLEEAACSPKGLLGQPHPQHNHGSRSRNNNNTRTYNSRSTTSPRPTTG